MPHKQMLAEVFTSNLEMVKMTLADFSDADMLCRPVPKANHALWQLGHLVNGEVGLLGSAVPGIMPALPDGFSERFGHEMTTCDDAAKFGANKQELLDLFAKARQAAIGWIKTVKIPELDKPSPERIRQFAPTLGHLAMLIPGHVNMHIGQFQVIRRALGKPVLF